MKDIYEIWKLETDNRDYETEYPYMVWDFNRDRPIGWYYDKTEAQFVYDHLQDGFTMKEIDKLIRGRK